MSFREKHLWVSIVSTVLVWGFYYFRLIRAVDGGALADPRFGWMLGGLFVVCLGVLVAIELVLTALTVLTSRKPEREVRDERETLASLKASHISLMALIALMFCLSIAAYLFGLGGPRATQVFAGMAPGVGLILVANVLMGAVIVSELTRFGFTLALIRRGR